MSELNKIHLMSCDCKVINELLDRILEMNFDLEKEKHEKYFASNSKFFRVLENRNETINEISSILNGYGPFNFEMVRIHKIDCYTIVEKQIAAVKKMEAAVKIASKIEKAV